MSEGLPTLGVVVVSFNSGDVITECLESLLASTGVRLKVVVVDNASPDDTVAKLRAWADGSAPFAQPAASPAPALTPAPKPLALPELSRGQPVPELGPLTLVHSGGNLGFAGGVNLGLETLRGQADWLWVLNPDCVVLATTAKAFADAAAAQPAFSLMGGRVVFYATPDRIQSDGGRLNRLTGVCSQIGYGAPAKDTTPPSASEVSWVSGANLLVSPQFLERVGPMREDYFLYYEEVDWAFRRGDLPLAVAPGAVVYHHGGFSIGSGAIGRRPSPFSNYFNHRNRLRFARRFLSPIPMGAYAYGLAKAAQLCLKGAPDEAYAIIAGMFEALPPPRGVRERLKGTTALARAEP